MKRWIFAGLLICVSGVILYRYSKNLFKDLDINFEDELGI